MNNNSLIYIAAKFISYSLWSYVGLLVLTNIKKPSLFDSLRLGLVRLFLGVGFGALVFLFYQTAQEELFIKYLSIYTPIRILEWGILALIIFRKSGQKISMNKKLILWIIAGVVVSFLVDLLSPEGLKGHFCIGRCLC